MPQITLIWGSFVTMKLSLTWLIHSTMHSDPWALLQFHVPPSIPSPNTLQAPWPSFSFLNMPHLFSPQSLCICCSSAWIAFPEVSTWLALLHYSDLGSNTSFLRNACPESLSNVASSHFLSCYPVLFCISLLVYCFPHLGMNTSRKWRSCASQSLLYLQTPEGHLTLSPVSGVNEYLFKTWKHFQLPTGPLFPEILRLSRPKGKFLTLSSCPSPNLLHILEFLINDTVIHPATRPAFRCFSTPPSHSLPPLPSSHQTDALF